MSSRRRSREKKAIPAKLRMDTKLQQPRITDQPSSRKREIEDVMKKARAQKSPTSGAFWDKKLLEVEAKDPNRWRHTGYKSMYIDGDSSSSSPERKARSRSPVVSRSRRSPRSPPLRRPSPRSPTRRVASPRSPPLHRSRGNRGRSSSSRRSPSGGGGSRRGLPPRPRSPPSPTPRTPRGSQRRSLTNSSISSCSDDSCSVCSPKGGHRNIRSRSRSYSPHRVERSKPPPQRYRNAVRTRPPSPPAPPKSQRVGRPSTPPSHPTATVRSSKGLQPPRPNPSDRPTDPRRQPPPPRPRGATGEVIDVRGVRPPARPGATVATKKTSAAPANAAEKPQPMLLKRIKKERTGPKRPGSPAESSGSDDSTATPTPTPIVATTNLTLSERFGKIAQWTADRERRDLENMRITKTGANMKVMVEDDYLYGTPPRRYSLSPVPTGHFPEKLMSSGQSRTAAWDDVRVRYQYYKDLGYLRDLTLDDYVKWEEWWYKYQDWLANERHYEHWLSTHGTGGNRRRKKRIPASQRLN